MYKHIYMHKCSTDLCMIHTDVCMCVCVYIYLYTDRHIHSVVSLGASGAIKCKESTCQCKRWVQIRSLNWEDPLEKEVATHCNILAWRIPWTEGSGNLQSLGSQVLDRTYCINHHYHALCIFLFKFNEIFSTGANSHLLPYSRILCKFVITISFCL